MDCRNKSGNDESEFCGALPRLQLSSPGTRVRLRRPEYRLDNPRHPVTGAVPDHDGRCLLDSRFRGNDSRGFVLGRATLSFVIAGLVPAIH